jgi:polyvinyl alcohol dehydrogenase (cytochrome)
MTDVRPGPVSTRGAERAWLYRYGRAAIASLALGLAAPLAVAGDWPMWQFNAQGIRHNPTETRITPANVGQLELKWVFAFPDTDGAASSQPAVVGDTLYVGGRNNIFYALDARTGQTKWTFDTTRVVGKYRDYATVNGLVEQLNDALAPLIFHYRYNPLPKNVLRNGPAVVDGVVYFGDFHGYLYALDAATGKLKWATEVDAHREAILTSSPLVYNGRVYIGVSSNEVFTALLPNYPCCQFRGSVVALDAKTGRIEWKYYTVPPPQKTGTNFSGAPTYGPSGVAVWSSPAVDPDSNTIFFGTGPNYSGSTDQSDSVIALDADSGALRWHFQAATVRTTVRTSTSALPPMCSRSVRRRCSAPWSASVRRPACTTSSMPKPVRRSGGRSCRMGLPWAAPPARAASSGAPATTRSITGCMWRPMSPTRA